MGFFRGKLAFFILDLTHWRGTENYGKAGHEERDWIHHLEAHQKQGGLIEDVQLQDGLIGHLETPHQLQAGHHHH